MQGKIKKIKDANGNGVFPITRGEAVFVEDAKTLTQKITELNNADHTHSNKTVLDGIGDSGGSLTYKGSTIGSGGGTATVSSMTDRYLGYSFLDISYYMWYGTSNNTTRPIYLKFASYDIWDYVTHSSTKTSWSSFKTGLPSETFETSFKGIEDSLRINPGKALVTNSGTKTLTMIDLSAFNGATQRLMLGNLSGVPHGYLFEYYQMRNMKEGQQGIEKTAEIMPLYLQTACKTNEPYHPHVIYFANGWKGYKYWMAETPWPINFSPATNRDTLENPHIHKSNDGFDWEVHQQIEGLPTFSGYHSDPHLIYRPDLDRLECWYRKTYQVTAQNPTEYTIIVRRYTTDGATWSDWEQLIDERDIATSGIDRIVRAPAILWDATTSKYRMWFNTSEPTNYADFQFWYGESSDGVHWTNVQRCTMDYAQSPWHSDVVKDGNTYYWVNYSRRNGIYLYVSNDAVNWRFARVLLKEDENMYSDFYAHYLYRSTLLKTDQDWRLYFTGETTERAGVGVMIGKTPFDLKPVSGNYQWRKQYFHKGIGLVNNGKYSSGIQLADTGESIGFDYSTKEPYFQKADGTKIYFTR